MIFQSTSDGAKSLNEIHGKIIENYDPVEEIEKARGSNEITILKRSEGKYIAKLDIYIIYHPKKNNNSTGSRWFKHINANSANTHMSSFSDIP